MVLAVLASESDKIASDSAVEKKRMRFMPEIILTSCTQSRKG